MTPVSLTERVLLALILAIGAGLRVWLLLGPFSEIGADPSTSAVWKSQARPYLAAAGQFRLLTKPDSLPESGH